jgi:hypothetical protein
MSQTPVLTSWKEIAAYLGKGVRTVQRWEGELQLPVRRPYGVEKHVVIALPEELDRWVREQLRPRTDTPNGEARGHVEEVQRMQRLLSCMVERTRVLQDNVEILRKNAERMMQARSARNGKSRYRGGEVEAEATLAV